MDTVFFVASKLVGALLRPVTWIVIALAGIVLALILQRRRMALWTISSSLVLLMTLSTLPLGDLLLQPIERHYPAHPDLDAIEGIIVLGGGEDARASVFWGQAHFGTRPVPPPRRPLLPSAFFLNKA